MSIERKDEHDHEAWIEEKDLTPIESTFLTVLVWLDKRIRIVDYLELLEGLYYRVNLQMPKSHTEQYNLDNKFWYWYPLYSLGFFSTLAYVSRRYPGHCSGSTTRRPRPPAQSTSRARRSRTAPSRPS